MTDSQNDLALKRFGKYLILDHLSNGGMARICRARYLGKQASKVVAIKMIQSKFSENESFRKMFEDEVRVSFGLLHPNIIQTYDYGVFNEQLYVAMEYCDGKNIKEYTDKLKSKKVVFPIHIITYLISEVCKGLHYAHSLTDKLSGKSANIIHRDISPHNIMLTYDGTVKIIDFGIAKTQDTSDMTQAGTIKGKLSYLAPEYLEGMTLDGRYDQFAVGITMWEMLCGRKLFKAENDLAVLKQIQECKIPAPSKINPNVPPDLDAIVLKMLERDREKRYADMTILNRDLIKFLFSHFPDFNPSDLSIFSKSLFRDEIETDRLKLNKFGQIDITPYLHEMKTGKGEQGDQSDEVSIESSEGLGKIEPRVLDFGFTEATKKTKIAMKNKRREGTVERKISASQGIEAKERSRSTQNDVPAEKNDTLTLGLGSLKKNTGVSKVPSMGLDGGDTNHNNNKKRTKAPIKKEPVQKEKKSGFNIIALSIVASLCAFYIGKDKVLSFYDEFSSKVANRVPGSSSNITERNGQNKINGTKVDATIELIGYNSDSQRAFVNGKEIKVGVLGEFKATLSSFVLRVQTIGREHFVKHINLEAEQSRLAINIANMPTAVYGHLKLGDECVSGEIEFELFGESRIEKISKGAVIGFPIQITKDGKMHPTEHTIHVKKLGRSVASKATFTLSDSQRSVYLCDLILK